MPSLSLKASINYPIIGGSDGPSTLLNGLLHYWSFNDTINLDTNQLWYSPSVSGSPYLRHRTRVSDDPVNPLAEIQGDILNFGITQGILGNATFGSVISQLSGQPQVRNTNCVFTTANNSTTPVNIAPLGSVFTINLWTKADGTESDWMIFAKHSRELGTSAGITFQSTYGGIAFNFPSESLINSNDGGNYIQCVDNFTFLGDNIWRMVSIVCDGSIATIYLNGNANPLGNDGLNIATITGPIDSVSLPLNINFEQGYYESGGLYAKSASQDEFGIWNRALTNSEILNLYNNGLGKAYPFS